MLSFPEFRQTYEYDCGANAMQSILAYYGFDVAECEIMKLARTKAKTGTPIAGLKKVAKKYNLKYDGKKMTVADLKKYLDRKIPVILLLQAWTKKEKIDWPKWWSENHYVVVIGYDKKKIYFEDPASTLRVSLTSAELEERWHGINPLGSKKINFGLAVFGKKGDYNLKKLLHMD